VAVLRIRDVYPGSRLPVPTFSIPDPGSRVDKIPDPDQHQRVSVFLTQKTDTQFLKIKSGMFNPDPGSWIILDQGVKIAPEPGSRFPDPDPKHCTVGKGERFSKTKN
jgi:hypothetical protein